MGKYEKYVIQKPLEYTEKGPKCWYKGDIDFDGADFTLVFIAVDHDLVMEASPHSHDFDMWVFHLPLESDNMDNLAGEIEFCFGAGTGDDPMKSYTLTKTNCVFVPAGTVHGPQYFKNITKPVLFFHAMRKGDYYKSKVYDSN